MKTNKIKKKLTLHKETIATLTKDNQQAVIGGVQPETDTCGGSICPPPSETSCD